MFKNIATAKLQFTKISEHFHELKLLPINIDHNKVFHRQHKDLKLHLRSLRPRIAQASYTESIPTTVLAIVVEATKSYKNIENIISCSTMLRNLKRKLLLDRSYPLKSFQMKNYITADVLQPIRPLVTKKILRNNKRGEQRQIIAAATTYLRFIGDRSSKTDCSLQRTMLARRQTVNSHLFSSITNLRKYSELQKLIKTR